MCGFANKMTEDLLTLITEREGRGIDPETDCWNSVEKQYGPDVYAQILYLLTRMEFEQAEAKDCWLDICAHERDMSQRQGRSVGLRVALCDYFINVHRMVKNPVIVEIQLFLQRERHAMRDELTGLYNRRYFNAELAKEIERFKRFGHPFSLLMVDIDHFKSFNDNYGHQAGDAALRKLSDVLQDSARLIDTVARFGGEEFVMILPQTNKEQAVAAAERFVNSLRRHCLVEFEGKCLGSLTASVGAATFPDDAMTPETLIARADEALYQAKHNGRDRVEGYCDKRRRFPRYPVTLNFALRSFGSEEEFINCSALNVSLGGIQCETSVPLSRGELLEVELGAMRDGKIIPMNATAVRIDKDDANPRLYHMALSFMVDSQDYRKTIVNILDTGREDQVTLDAQF